MKQILFSCVGTTDPVRGEHDGPILHILRHYRPESVLLFLTPEIRELAETDDRFGKTGTPTSLCTFHSAGPYDV